MAFVLLTKTNTAPYAFPLWLKASLFTLALAKLWLVRGQGIFAIWQAGHDDALFVEHARTMIEGRWLGAFSQMTLIKGPFYSFWIGASFLSGIPLLLSEHLLYIAACIVFVFAIRPFIPNSVALLITYAVLLFNPMSFNDIVIGRVIRDGIYPALTMLSLAGAIGMLARCERTNRNLIAWSIGTGLALSAFWLTREEGLWIVPSIVLIFVSLAVMRWRQSTDHRVRSLVPCVLAFCVFLIPIGTVRLLNWIKYRVFITVELTSPSFVSAYGALTRVKHAHWSPRVPLPRETRERIYEASPKFSALKSTLEEAIHGWLAGSCTTPAGCNENEIEGGWFIWAFRDAVANAGYYKAAPMASRYYQDLAAEINSACAEGKLDCLARRASLNPPWHWEYLRPLLGSFLHAGEYLASFRDFRANSIPNTGSEEELRPFRDITLGSLSPRTEDRHITINGWAFSPDVPVQLSVRAENGDLVPFTLSSAERPDVYRHFLGEGKDMPNAAKSGFTIGTSCIDCYIYVAGASGLIDRIKIGEKFRQTPHLFFFQDGLQDDSIVLPAQVKMDNLRIKWLTEIARLYQFIVPVVVVLALIPCTLEILWAFKRRSITGLDIAQTALLLAIVMRLLILSMVDVSSFSAISVSYLSSAYPLLLMFLALTFLTCFPKCRST